MQRSSSMTVVVTAICLWGVSSSAVAADSSAHASVGDALQQVKGDESSWNVCCLFAFGIQIGIPERQLMEAWPGVNWDSLPPVVLETLRKGSNGIPAWLACANDSRLTQIVENDLFGGGSSKDARRLKCSTAALRVLETLVPSGAFKGAPDAQPALSEFLKKTFLSWEQSCHGQPANERMRQWFEQAGEAERRMFLAVVIQTRHSPAYPLLEASFLKRAANPDPFLYLEVAAYIRHRCAGVRDFYRQIATELSRHKTDSHDFDNFLQSWDLLTKYGALEDAIQEWLAGRVGLDVVAAVLGLSIDQPWAYHSMPVEATAVHRPVMEANLCALVAAAERERALDKRISLLNLANSAAELIVTVAARSRETDRQPDPRFDSPSWRPTVAQLRELITDTRLSIDRDIVTTPSERAAGVVWSIWGEMRLRGDDWRNEQVDFHFGSTRSLAVDIVNDLFAHPDGLTPQKFPESDAVALAKRFTTGNAVDRRKQLSAMPWDKRILFQAQAERDSELGVRVWSRMMELVEWQHAESNCPAGFGKLWEDQLAKKKLDETTWAALRNWILAEAKAERYWSIIGDTSPCRPGITLYVLPSPTQFTSDGKQSVLKIQLAGKMFFESEKESYRITASGLARIPSPADNSVPNVKWPSPIEAIATQSQSTANDMPRVSGLMVDMFVMPPKP